MMLISTLILDYSTLVFLFWASASRTVLEIETSSAVQLRLSSHGHFLKLPRRRSTVSKSHLAPLIPTLYVPRYNSCSEALHIHHYLRNSVEDQSYTATGHQSIQERESKSEKRIKSWPSKTPTAYLHLALKQALRNRYRRRTKSYGATSPSRVTRAQYDHLLTLRPLQIFNNQRVPITRDGQNPPAQ
ncbi:hypothetical protein HDV63DRAFT_372563 [Trichoderma sp. SZMC 28014]